MPITFEFEEAQRRVIAMIQSDHDGVSITARFTEAVERRPELGEWDWVVEVSGELPPAVPWDLDRLRSLLDRPDTAADTVVVTADPVVEAWARLLSSNFRVRRHWVVQSRPAAIDLLNNKPTDRLMPFHEDAVNAWA